MNKELLEKYWEGFSNGYEAGSKKGYMNAVEIFCTFYDCASRDKLLSIYPYILNQKDEKESAVET